MLATSGLAEPGNEAGPPAFEGSARATDLVELKSLDSTLRIDLRYATSENFLGRAVYPREARALAQRPAAEALIRAHRRLASTGLGIIILDAYRPWQVTEAMWHATASENRAFVADPAKGSRHNRGTALDVTLFDLASGTTLEMPSGYDEWSERAYPTYAGGSATARTNRDHLREAMEAEGFFVHPYEWWHFDWKDWREWAVLDLPMATISPSTARPSTGATGATAPTIETSTSPRIHPAVKPSASIPRLDSARVIDLTWSFDEQTLYWPSSPSAFDLSSLARGQTAGGYFYSANRLCTPEHGGTHLDAPLHFSEAGWAADQIPAERLLGPGVVLDVSAKAKEDANYRLNQSDIDSFEAQYGKIPEGAIVLLRTGWSSRWPDRKAYFGDDVPERAPHLQFPSFGPDATRWLIQHRKVKALGVDTASIDFGPSTDFQVHRIAAEANVLGLENLTRLEALPPTGAWIIALPMKIAGGSGGPLRAIALLP